ncbi:MAG: Ig-like domain-containing protein, partial [Raineya sp.]
VSLHFACANPTDTLLFPERNATLVPANVRLQIYFDEPMQKGVGNVQIFDGTTSTQIFSIPVTCSCITIEANKVSIALPSLLSAGQVVYVKILNGVFKNMLNEPFSGFISPSEWRFTIAGGLITHQNFSPANNSFCVSLEQNTFQIVLSSPATSNNGGRIRIFEKITRNLHEAILLPSSQVIANNSNIISFTLSRPLKSATEYFILIDPVSFVGASSFVYEGIYDDNVWSFRTAEEKPNAENISTCGVGWVVLRVSSPQSGGRYRWYEAGAGGEPIRDENNQIVMSDTLRVFVRNSKTFFVTAWNANCESARTSIQVEVKPLPQSTLPPEEIRAGRGIKVNLEANGGIKYAWKPATGLSDPNIANPELIANENITYTVSIENEWGCVIEKQVNIIIDDSDKYFFLPTVFSPNND